MIALLGCGGWGRLVLRDLKALGAQVAVVARSPDSLDNAQKGGADRIVADVADLPDALDGVVIATPTDQHAVSIESVLPRNVPIFVEKAMTHDVAAAQSIVARAGDRVFVMDKWRYHPGVDALRQLVVSRRLGRPLALHLTRVSWSTNHSELDPVWLLAPHDLAIALHILGDVPTPRAASGRIIGPRGAELRAELASACGASVYIDVSSLRPVNRRMIALVCDNGSAELGGSYDEEVILRIGSSDPGQSTQERVTLPQSMPLEAELRCFLDYLRSGPAPMSSAAEGLAVVEALVELRRLAGFAS